MTDRIRIAELRATTETPIDSGRFDTHGRVLVDPDELAALLDLAEAAERHAAHCGGKGELHTWRELEVALARFDFGDQPE